MKRWRPWTVLTLLVPIAGACGTAGDEPDEPRSERTEEALEGLSPEQIRSRVEPMSPEMAESLGIVDTTIHVEDRSPEDSLLPPTLSGDTTR
jgi:hypothetical protein